MMISRKVAKVAKKNPYPLDPRPTFAVWAARKGHFFGAQSPKKRSYFPAQNSREMAKTACSRARLGNTTLIPRGLLPSHDRREWSFDEVTEFCAGK